MLLIFLFCVSFITGQGRGWGAWEWRNKILINIEWKLTRQLWASVKDNRVENICHSIIIQSAENLICVHEEEEEAEGAAEESLTEASGVSLLVGNFKIFALLGLFCFYCSTAQPLLLLIPSILPLLWCVSCSSLIVLNHKCGKILRPGFGLIWQTMRRRGEKESLEILCGRLKASNDSLWDPFNIRMVL